MNEGYMYGQRIMVQEDGAETVTCPSLEVIDTDAVFNLFQRTTHPLPDLVQIPFRLDIRVGSRYLKPDYQFGLSFPYRRYNPYEPTLMVGFSIIVDTKLPFNPHSNFAKKHRENVGQYNLDTLIANEVFFHEWKHMLYKMFYSTNHHFVEELICNSYAEEEVTRVVSGQTQPIIILP